MSGFVQQFENAFTAGGNYEGEKILAGIGGAVAVAGAGYLGYEEWLKHHQKPHSEQAVQEFQSQVQPGFENDPAYQAKYADHPNPPHKRHHHHHQNQ
ncbi:hypothetical protein HDV00_006411 [Rhizophlyctis rosea]|nr:hypothetical protein HDV00_006411 [Rhizophlyctis rosea]